MLSATRRLFALVLFFASCSSAVLAQETKKALIPHAQDKEPNEPRDPQTAAKLMTVPEGFSVEVVAAEPDIVNPVAMAIDEKGRFWITESLEYPRREPGVGKDRVKILEDTDGDGRCDKFSIFLDGLNIPSGVAVGHGGVWIANSPDILFVPDADRDGKPDGPAQVVVTGFGRTDTHELPNSLTWGPDGWLYGLNGVFNHSHVKYSKENPNFKEDHKGWPLTCAMFRIHPRTREFQVFCEGTSNPWGIAFNDEGEAFVSACVIDHLWHLVETGYYHRQGGPYPPFTWKIDSIVKHKHQKAAYCGIHYFDSDAYPEKYRGKLYMGNIHGGCINVDRIERDGSTYKGFGEDDFLTANDAWFMPVVQKTGPDGCLYILDWYDRYHCYQDANRDPAGIDRLKGRLYRVRYKDSPRAPKHLDLAKETDEKLIGQLGVHNDYLRTTALRLLQERNKRSVSDQLTQFLIDGEYHFPKLHRHHNLFVQSGMTDVDWNKLCDAIKNDPDPTIRSWRIRLLADHAHELTGHNLVTEFVNQAKMAKTRQELLQVSSGIAKFERLIDQPTQPPVAFQTWCIILDRAGDDPLLARIVWQNLHPQLEDHADGFLSVLQDGGYLKLKAVADLMPRVTDRILGRQKFDAKPVGKLFAMLRDDHSQVGREVLEVISAKVQSGELKGERLDQLKVAMSPHLKAAFDGPADSALYLNAAFLATAFGDKAGFAAARKAVETTSLSEDQRLAAVSALVAAGQDDVLASVAKIFEQTPAASSDFKGKLLASLARLDDPEVGKLALHFYPKMEPDLQPKVVELLTQRAGWAKQLLAAVGAKKIDASVININQARRLKELKDEELSKLLATHWGQVREGRDPNREKYIADMKALIRKSPGDALAGEKAFKKVCAQCHKLYGEGAEVGPDITRNGRNDFTQLLSNVFDPSLVIGAGYRSYTVVTNGGRVINGLLAEDSPQRVVLKIQGGKQEVIARADIDEFKVSEISLMPEQLEKQLSQQEIIDLFAFITLDKHPSDPNATQLPGVREPVRRETTKPEEFGALVNEILPGFTTTASGEGGVAILDRPVAGGICLRTHPVNRDTPCVLTQKIKLPDGFKQRLILMVSNDPRGDWRLVVRGNGERLADETINKDSGSPVWRTLVVDLGKFAGQEVKLDLVNQANDWSYEFAYWKSARIESSGFSNRKNDPSGRTRIEISGREAKITEVATGKRLFDLSRTHFDAFHNAYKESGKFVAPYPQEIEQGLIERRPLNGPVSCWAYSEDGRFLAIGSGTTGPMFSHGEVRVFDLTTGYLVIPDPKWLKDDSLYVDRRRKNSHTFGSIELRLVHATSHQPLNAMSPVGVFQIGEVASIHFDGTVLTVEAQPFAQDGK